MSSKRKKLGPFQVTIKDPQGLTTIEINSGETISTGRGKECDLRIRDTKTSRKHLKITHLGNAIEVTDLGSANGSRIDGKRFDKTTRKDDFTLEVGNSLIEIKQVSSSPGRMDRKTPARVASEGETVAPPRRRRSYRAKKSVGLGTVVTIGVLLTAIGYVVNDLGRSAREEASPIVGAATDSSPIDSTGGSIPLPPALDLGDPAGREDFDSHPALRDPETPVETRPPGILETEEPDAQFGSGQESRDDEVPRVVEIPPPADPTQSRPIVMRLVNDAWPPSDRVIAYEFNQKNHHSPPDFIDRRKGQDRRRWTGKQKQYRVIGVEVENRGDTPRKLKLSTPSHKGGKKLSVEVEPRSTLRKTIPIIDPGSSPLKLELFDSEGELVDQLEELLGEGRRTAIAEEAIAIAREREREEWEREQLQPRPIGVRVLDNIGRPVPGASVLCLLEDGMAILEGSTDRDGRWTGTGLPGAYTVIAHSRIPEEEVPEGQTSVRLLPRLLMITGRLAAESEEVVLAPDREVLVKANIFEAGALHIERVWLTPEPIAGAFQYERIARQISRRGRLESETSIPRGELKLLLGGLPVDLTAVGRTGEGNLVLLRGRTAGNREELPLTFYPQRFSTLTWNPERAAGGSKDATVEVVSIDGFRERLTFEPGDSGICYLFPGEYRLDLRCSLPGGEIARFLPYRVNLAPGESHPLEPRAPWKPLLHFKRKGKDVQLWLSLQDQGDRILERVPANDGELVSTDRSGNVMIEKKLGQLRWQEIEKLQSADLGKLRTVVTVPFGDEVIRGLAPAQRLRVVNAAGCSAEGPSVFEARMLAMMPEVKKSMVGCWETLGLPDGAKRLHMAFDIFLPPGIGGLGGGGVIVLDTVQLYRYTGAGDLLPGAYRHELGHNLGFGHDPYMLLADHGVDEGLYGELGYRLLHSASFQRTLEWLFERRSEKRTHWQPDPGVFPALRFLHGKGTHRKMIIERRSAEQTLRLHTLSSIERIAALYSLTLNRNVAWVFRANGWPVFDDRVDIGGTAVKFAKTHPKQLNYQRLDGTPMPGWWVQGPLEGVEKSADWRRILWPTNFIDLATGLPATRSNRRWLLLRRIAIPEDIEARIVCASDVQLQLRVNGIATGFIDASSQMSQPAHDELMLDQKRPLSVRLARGENLIEVAVNQPPGSRGFHLELMTVEGKPVTLAPLDEGPDGEPLSETIDRFPELIPIRDGSFDLNSSYDPDWITGAIEPGGSLRFDLDSEHSIDGSQSLRGELVRPGSGAVIQRIVVEPNSKYRLQGAIRTEGFEGEALVGLFTGELGGWKARTEPIRKDFPQWRSISFDWFPGPSRVVYIACYLKGQKGRAWFDGLRLEKIR